MFPFFVTQWFDFAIRREINKIVSGKIFIVVLRVRLKRVLIVKKGRGRKFELKLDKTSRRKGAFSDTISLPPLANR